MKNLIAFLTVFMFINTASAFDLASMANKVQSAADKASAKIEEVQEKTEEKSSEKAEQIEDKIEELQEKIADWQSSDSANSSETLQAIANAKASIEKLLAQLKALRGE